jgi:O-antigen/teichoic acid export membrane protein
MLEKIKELTKDTALYGISTIAGRFLQFILVPFYTHVFSPEEFGIQAYIYAFLAFANVVYIYGMDAAFMKYATVQESDKKTVFSTSYVFTLITTILFSLILYLSRNWLATEANYTQYSYIFLYVIGILFLDSLALIPFANLRLERKAAKFATIRILNILINVTLNLVLILHYHYGIEAIFISNLVASAFSLLALLPEIFKNISITIDKEYLIKMLKFGIPYLPGSIAATMVQMIDVPIIKELTDEATLGIYRANYKLGIFMLLFVSMFNYAWQPFFLTNAKEKNAKEIFAKVLSLFLIIASLIWVVLSLFIEDLASIEFLNGKTIIAKEFLVGVYIVPIVLLAYIFHGLYVNFTAGIYLEEKTKFMPMVTGFGAVVNIISNFILVPKIGILGGALATLLSYLVMSVSIFIVSQKYYKVDYEYLTIGKVFLTIGVIISLFYYFTFYNQINLPIKFGLLATYFILIFALRIIKLSEVKTTLNILLKRK